MDSLKNLFIKRIFWSTVGCILLPVDGNVVRLVSEELLIKLAVLVWRGAQVSVFNLSHQDTQLHSLLLHYLQTPWTQLLLHLEEEQVSGRKREGRMWWGGERGTFRHLCSLYSEVNSCINLISTAPIRSLLTTRPWSRYVTYSCSIILYSKRLLNLSSLYSGSVNVSVQAVRCLKTWSQTVMSVRQHALEVQTQTVNCSSTMQSTKE